MNDEKLRFLAHEIVMKNFLLQFRAKKLEFFIYFVSIKLQIKKLMSRKFYYFNAIVFLG